MAASITNYKGVSIISPDPTGSGGSALNANFKTIADTLANQATDLAAKAATASLATVATSGSYTDLANKPTIPAAQVNSDWNASSGVSQILNKPTINTLLPTQTGNSGKVLTTNGPLAVGQCRPTVIGAPPVVSPRS